MRLLEALHRFAAAALLCVSAAAAAQEAPRYDMRVRILPNALAVDMEVTLPPTREPRASLQFELLPGMGAPEVRLAGANGGTTLAVRRIGEGGDALKPRATWRIEPAAAFPADRPIALRISYSGGGGGALVHYVGPEFIIASGIVQPWYPQFSNRKIVGSLSLDMPPGFLALASGDQVSDRTAAGRRQMDFRMTVPTQFDFAAGALRVVEAPRRAGEIPVRLYLLRDRDFAGELVGIVRSSIAILEREFGPFPVRQFAVVEFPTEAGRQAHFSGASQGGYILMRSDDLDRRRADPRDSYFAHEIGHQWWGVSVSASGADGGDYMLDEALAEYGAIRVNEVLLGPEGARAFRDDARDKALNRIAAGYDGPLSDLPEPTPSQLTFFHADVGRSKGALVYDVFAQSIGTERMRRFFHEMTRDYAHSSHITWHGFVDRLKAAAGPDKRWLVDQWLNRRGLPVLGLNWSRGNRGVTVAIQQGRSEMPLYRLTLPVRLVYADGGAEVRRVEIAAQPETRILLPTSKAVSSIELDPGRTMPWVSREEHATAVAIRNYTLAWQFDNEGKRDRAKQLLEAALQARIRPDATPGEFLERYYYGWLIEEDGRISEAIEQYMRALQLPVRDERRLPQLYVNIARAAAATGDRARARWAAQAAVDLAESLEEDSRRRGIRDQARQYLD